MGKSDLLLEDVVDVVQPLPVSGTLWMCLRCLQKQQQLPMVGCRLKGLTHGIRNHVNDLRLLYYILNTQVFITKILFKNIFRGEQEEKKKRDYLKSCHCILTLATTETLTLLSFPLKHRTVVSHQQGPWGGSLESKVQVKFACYSCMKTLHSGSLVIANDGGRKATARLCRPRHYCVISSFQTPGVCCSKLCQALY